MTRHQRCQAAIDFAPVDQVPTYVTAIADSVASELLGRKAYAGTTSLHYAEACAWIKGEQAHTDFVEQLMFDMREVQRALGIDVIRMPWRLYGRPSRQLDEYTFIFGDPEGDHSVWQYMPDSTEFAMLRSVNRSGTPRDQIIRQSLEEHDADPGLMERQVADELAAHERFCARFDAEFYTIMTSGWIAVGIDEEAMMVLAEFPELVGRQMALLGRRAALVGRALARTSLPKVMQGGGDLAGNTGLMYSPLAFRDLVLPAYKHALSALNPLGVHYAFRSDGDLWSITDMLFEEAKCPGYGETDRDASMTVAALRKRYPKLVIWGNFSSSFLQHATPQQVRDEARRQIDEAGGRGYFAAPSNAIVHGTPPANVEAFYSVR